MTSITIDSNNPYYKSIDGVLFNKDATTLILYPRGKSGSYTIPDSVTSIGRWAFYGCDDLTSITIPDSVTSIRDSAFYSCSGLTSITIPGSVTTTGEDVFSYCSGLTEVSINNDYCVVRFTKLFPTYADIRSIVLGDAVTEIGGHAFSGCSGLTSITIPDSVTTIDSSAFHGCSGLTSVSIGNGVTSIHDSYYPPQNVFEDCPQLTSVTINNDYCVDKFNKLFPTYDTIQTIVLGDSVTSLGRTFSGCSGLTSITVDSNNPNYKSIDGVLFNKAGTTLICYPGGKTGSYTIPDAVTSIGSSAFSGCAGLTSITIPDSVATIGSSAFSGCSGLTSITIPDSVTSIDAYVFNNCISLTSATINCACGVSNFRNIFYGCNSLTAVTIGNSVTSIGSSAFSGCDGLTEITYGGTTNPCQNYASLGLYGQDISVNLPSDYGADEFCGISVGSSSDSGSNTAVIASVVSVVAALVIAGATAAYCYFKNPSSFPCLRTATNDAASDHVEA